MKKTNLVLIDNSILFFSGKGYLTYIIFSKEVYITFKDLKVTTLEKSMSFELNFIFQIKQV